MSYRTQKEVRTHVALRGFDESFIQGEGNGQPLLVEKDNADESLHLDSCTDLHRDARQDVEEIEESREPDG